MFVSDHLCIVLKMLSPPLKNVCPHSLASLTPQRLVNLQMLLNALLLIMFFVITHDLLNIFNDMCQAALDSVAPVKTKNKLFASLTLVNTLLP